MGNILMKISGMSCQNCVRNVEQALKKEQGVNSATVDLKKKQASISAQEGVDQNKLIAAVEAAGYGAAIDSATSQPII